MAGQHGRDGSRQRVFADGHNEDTRFPSSALGPATFIPDHGVVIPWQTVADKGACLVEHRLVAHGSLAGGVNVERRVGVALGATAPLENEKWSFAFSPKNAQYPNFEQRCLKPASVLEREDAG